MLHAMMYLSLASQPPLTREILEAVASQSMQRNRDLQVTGYLYGNHGIFVQYLEGPKAALETAWASIRQDPRHTIVSEVHLPAQAERRFPHWEMQLLTPQMLHPHLAVEKLFLGLEDYQQIDQAGAQELLTALAGVIANDRQPLS